jgi:hypothetical protein
VATRRIGPIGIGTAALHLGALWALALAQPMFGMLGESAEFFVARDNTGSDIVLLALGYGLVPPLVCAAGVWAAGRIRPALGWALHLTFIALLVGALALPPLGRALGGSSASVAVALLVGAAAALAYRRTAAAQMFLTLLSPAPLVVLVLFLVLSPVADLVWAGHAGAASVAGPSRSSTPIVHVILDELPVTTLEREDGRFESDLFPNLARLVRGATWYRNGTTVADSTADAIPVQLTGRRPRIGGLPTTRDHPRSVFGMFSRSHDLFVVEPVTDVCPVRLCPEARPAARARLRSLAKDLSVAAGHLLLPGDLRKRLPPIDESWQGFDDEPDGAGSSDAPEDAPERRRLMARLVTRLRANDARPGFERAAAFAGRVHDRPPLVFIHSTLPHAPWRYLPDGRVYDLRKGSYPGLGELWHEDQWAIDHAFQRHVLQVRYVDALLGRLLKRLRAAGLYDRAVIVVTADHGASFRAGEERRALTPGNLAEIAAVPFIVKYPGQREGRIDDRAVRTIDVLPTIARAAGVRVPWATDGIPADERPVSTAARIDVTRAAGPGQAQSLAAVNAVRRERNAHEARLLRRGLFALGPRPDLVGRRVDGVAPARSGVTAAIAGAREYADIRPGDAVVPALVAGEVTGLDEGAVIAIAVNGRIEATTKLLRRGDHLLYAALVPPDSLRPGANRVTVVAVGRDDLRTISPAAA